MNVLVALYTPYAVLRLYGVYHHGKDVMVSRRPVFIEGRYRAMGTRTRGTFSRYHCQFYVSETGICHFEGQSDGSLTTSHVYAIHDLDVHRSILFLWIFVCAVDVRWPFFSS